MTLQHPLQVAQAAHAPKLYQHHRHKVAPVRQTPLLPALPMRRRRPLEPAARNLFQQLTENRRLILHGLALLEPRSTVLLAKHS
jgi:hypothetical protein